MGFNETHPVINVPETDIILWRYMDVPSFMALITNNNLTFVRADLFEDRFEGVLPKKTSQMLDLSAQIQIKEGKLNPSYENLSSIINSDRTSTFMNCWTMENHEMVHMWKIYSKENGIAIKTTYSKLKQAFETQETIYPTIINYIDFENDVVDWQSNMMTAYTLKRNEYKSEKEFRLLLSNPREVEDQFIGKFKGKKPHEINFLRRSLYQKYPIINCPIDSNELIQSIQISPYAPKWYLKLIKDIVKKYNLKINSIGQSDL